MALSLKPTHDRPAAMGYLSLGDPSPAPLPCDTRRDWLMFWFNLASIGVQWATAEWTSRHQKAK